MYLYVYTAVNRADETECISYFVIKLEGITSKRHVCSFMRKERIYLLFGSNIIQSQAYSKQNFIFS